MTNAVKDRSATLQKTLLEQVILTRPRPEWTRRGNLIDFFVTSYGASNVELLEEYKKNNEMNNYTTSMERVLKDKSLHLEKGVYRVTVLAGDEFASRPTRTTDLIRGQAHTLGLVDPHPALAFLIRQKFTDADLRTMGLWAIVVMHKTYINQPYRTLLGVREVDNLIIPFNDHASQNWCGGWNQQCGFAFVHSFQNEMGWKYA